jgi:DNA helicase II / ATP-dependent DNA helicase PcrA
MKLPAGGRAAGGGPPGAPRGGARGPRGGGGAPGARAGRARGAGPAGGGGGVHANFGEGVVVGLEAGGLVVVRFAGDGSERKLMADYAPIRRR